MERREKERASTGRNGGRDTVEEKKSSSQPQQGAGGAGLARTHARTHTQAHTHSELGLHTVQAARSSTSSTSTLSFPARGRGEGKGKEGEEGGPLAQTLYADWTRIGCLARKGRLLSVLTDPAALVPDRGGTVNQSHALACRSTAHLACNPHALPPWAPASLPTLPPTCSLMPSLRVSDRADQLNGLNLHSAPYSTAMVSYSGLALFLFFLSLSFSFLALLSPPPLPVMSAHASHQGSHQFETFLTYDSQRTAARIRTNERLGAGEQHAES